MKKHLTKYGTTSEFELDIDGRDYPNVSYDDEADKLVYALRPDYSKRCLTFISEADGNYFWINSFFMYSLDNGETWEEASNSKPSQAKGTRGATKAPVNNYYTPIVNDGDSIMLAAEMEYVQGWQSTGAFKAIGNPMSLLWGAEFADDEITSIEGINDAFRGMFAYNTNLTDASGMYLTATVLAPYAYHTMFEGCESLTAGPQISDCLDWLADNFDPSEPWVMFYSDLMTLNFDCSGYKLRNTLSADDFYGVFSVPIWNKNPDFRIITNDGGKYVIYDDNGYQIIPEGEIPEK